MIRSIVTTLLLFLVLTLAGCSGDPVPLTGTWRATSGDTAIELTLEKDGKGTWSTDLDEIPFKWTVRDDGSLWIHTREGGVIPGKIANKTLRVSLPGMEPLAFTK